MAGGYYQKQTWENWVMNVKRKVKGTWGIGHGAEGVQRVRNFVTTVFSEVLRKSSGFLVFGENITHNRFP